MDLLNAQVALLRAQWKLRTKPVGSLVQRASEVRAEPTGDERRAREIALAIERVSERGLFRPRCLARSIALRDSLMSVGITGSVIRVGVRSENGRFLAHAWVTWGPHVLGDRAHWVASFSEVEDLRVFPDA